MWEPMDGLFDVAMSPLLRLTKGLLSFWLVHWNPSLARFVVRSAQSKLYCVSMLKFYVFLPCLVQRLNCHVSNGINLRIMLDAMPCSGWTYQV